MFFPLLIAAGIGLYFLSQAKPKALIYDLTGEVLDPSIGEGTVRAAVQGLGLTPMAVSFYTKETRSRWAATASGKLDLDALNERIPITARFDSKPTLTIDYAGEA